MGILSSMSLLRIKMSFHQLEIPLSAVNDLDSASSFYRMLGRRAAAVGTLSSVAYSVLWLLTSLQRSIKISFNITNVYAAET